MLGLNADGLRRLLREEDKDQKGEIMGSLIKNEERNKGLIDVVFSWSIDDIMNNHLYRNKVNKIEDTFSSVDHYLKSFIKPLIEEMHADLRSSMTTLHFAPAREILEIVISKQFEPPENSVHLLKLKNSTAGNSYEPEVGDLIALAEMRPKRIDDLNGPKFSYVVALVEGMSEAANCVTIVSSKILFLDEGINGKMRCSLFAVKLTNLKTNLRIWKALHPGEGGNMDILNSVLRINPSMEENCALCSKKIESSDLSKSRELIMSLGLDDSQRNAVLKCIALRECNHRSCVKLIWGPPGTGKTKTIASLLFSLFRIKCRTLTCAPTNVAVLGVAKGLMSCLNGTLKLETYGLGDVVLFGNGKKMKIGEHEDLHDVFLDYRISSLMFCLAPNVGWMGCVVQMIRLLEDPESQYQLYLERLKDRDDAESGSGSEDENDEDGEDLLENGSLKETLRKDLLKKLVIENAEKNERNRTKGKVNTQDRRKSKCDGDQHSVANDEGNIPLTFKEFFAKEVFRIVEKISFLTELLYTHMPTSHLPLNEVRNMIRVVGFLQTLENFLRDNEWSKGALIGSASNLYGIRIKCLVVMNLLRETDQVPKFFERNEIRNFCLENACLIFSTASSSSKLHTQGMAAFELVIIDEAAQVKECESSIPLQFPGLRHAILVGDQKQLPAMVKSKICEKAGFGRSLFERLVILGHNKHLLNVQYRMHPSISLFPNKEFYANQIRNGPNVTERAHERHFIKEEIYGPYSFINITNGKEEFDGRHSLKNIVEVSVVAEIVSKLYKESTKSKEKVRVGCISPYNGQVSAIQESLKSYSSDAKEKFSVNVRSVDGFQGGEEDIIIISTVRCNGNGSVGFLDNLQRANVALTRARHCLWILGNGATLQNSGTVWKRLVADAKNRGCFHNAYEDSNLSGAISNALIKLGQQRSLFTADSILFKTAKWKVRFSPEFNESITRYGDSEIQKEVASLLEKLSNGWRQRRKDEAEGARASSSLLLEFEVVKEPLRLVWSIDIIRESSTETQAIKVLDILPRSEVAELAKKFELLVGNYTVSQLNRCLFKRSEGGVMLPMTWPVDRADSSRSNYSGNDLATQLGGISLRDDSTSPRRRNHMKWRSNHRVQHFI